MHGQLNAEAIIGGERNKTQLRVTVLDSGKVVAKKQVVDNNLLLSVKSAKLWSPSSLFLYDLEIELLGEDGSVLDKVTSYAGFRSVGKECDKNGNWQFTLNGKKIFHLGPLDQGWWPGSFLLPPSDEAIVWDMDYLKKGRV